MKRSSSLALVGFLLGLGAPIGALALQLVHQHRGDLTQWMGQEWHTHAWHYVYLTISAVIAFTLFGYWAGRRLAHWERRAAILQDETESLTQLSMTDGLTGLFNHRYIQERLEIEFERSSRYQTALSVLMIDIDDFKKINDRFGHVVGDEALRHVARLIQQSVRRVDIAGRYGGEEFLIILPQTGAATAHEVAERIRLSIGEKPLSIDTDQPVSLTVTIGLAAAPHPGYDTRSRLLEAADESLYRGKREGKNRTVASV